MRMNTLVLPAKRKVRPLKRKRTGAPRKRYNVPPMAWPMKRVTWADICPKELAAARLERGTRSGMAAEMAGPKKADTTERVTETRNKVARMTVVRSGQNHMMHAKTVTATPLVKSLRIMIVRRDSRARRGLAVEYPPQEIGKAQYFKKVSESV